MLLENAAKPVKPNFTAWFVMQGLVSAAHRPAFSGAVPQKTLDIYKALALESSKARLISKLIYHLPYGWQYVIGELVTTEGRLRHFILRKREIEKQARQYLQAGDVSQVVILGAGLDVLSLQLAKDFPVASFIEIDVEESQRFKAAALKAHHIDIPSNVEHLAGDLSLPLAETLARSAFFETGKKTLWLAEGLFMFIPEASVSALFSAMRSVSAEGSGIVFTTIPECAQGSALARKLQKLVLRRESSSFVWSIAAEAVPAYVKKTGWTVSGQIPYHLLHKGYMPQNSDLNMKIGEDIHIAKM